MTATPPKPPPRRASTQEPLLPHNSKVSEMVPPKASGPRLGVIAPTFEPPRIVLNAVEGWGKTSYLAHAPGAAVLMAKNETGYATLLGVGRVPQIPAAMIEDWPGLLAMVDGLIVDPQGCKVLGLDAMGGFERMCHEFICDRDFKGDWGEKGFSSFQKGYEVSVSEWLKLLGRLDHLRRTHGTTIVFLGHSRIRPFKNPDGPDYDRYASDANDKTWAVTAKWADAVFFGKFEAVIDGGDTGDKAKKGKGVGVGGQRRMYAERRDAFDAKNRYGMPESFLMPEVPAETWDFVWAKITQGKVA